MNPIKIKSAIITVCTEGNAILSFSILGIPFEVPIYRYLILWAHEQSNAMVNAPLGDNVIPFPRRNK